jgi:hypothetical protein
MEKKEQIIDRRIDAQQRGQRGQGEGSEDNLRGPPPSTPLPLTSAGTCSAEVISPFHAVPCCTPSGLFTATDMTPNRNRGIM